MDLEDVNNSLEKAYKVESVLHTLVDFEDVLEKVNIYAYDHWGAGEIAMGPEIDKYWITVTLMYPYRMMPDPEGAERLVNKGCKVYYKQDQFIEPGTIRGPDDIDFENKETDLQKGRLKAKPKRTRVWLVTIEMPRSLLQTNEMDKIQFSDDNIDLEDVQRAEDEELDTEGALQNANQ